MGHIFFLKQQSNFKENPDKSIWSSSTYPLSFFFSMMGGRPVIISFLFKKESLPRQLDTTLFFLNHPIQIFSRAPRRRETYPPLFRSLYTKKPIQLSLCYNTHSAALSAGIESYRPSSSSSFSAMPLSPGPPAWYYWWCLSLFFKCIIHSTPLKKKKKKGERKLMMTQVKNYVKR